MTASIARRQGQPVLFLGLLFGGWCLLRVLTWQTPWPEALALPEALRFADMKPSSPAEASAHVGAFAATARGRGEPRDGHVGEQMPIRPAFEALALLEPPSGYAAHFDRHRRALGHNLLFAAGMAYLPMPRSLAAALDRAPETEIRPGDAARQPAGSPWRLDAWALVRQGGARLIGGGERPASYGSDQIGAVLAYRLAPGSMHEPATYARITHALADRGETDTALGLRARPVPAIPVDIHAEGRLTHRPGRAAEFRPAVFLAGGFDSRALPAGIDTRGYGQAGYVGGDFATAFVDGALVAERGIVRLGSSEVAVGAGAWGGAQRGAARLDLGPSISVKLELGGAPARIDADYRWRVAGRAEPGDGGVLTLSTGF